MRHAKRWVPLVLAAALILGTVPAKAAEPETLTRGKAAEMLLAAAGDYHHGVQQ